MILETQREIMILLNIFQDKIYYYFNKQDKVYPHSYTGIKSVPRTLQLETIQVSTSIGHGMLEMNKLITRSCIKAEPKGMVRKLNQKSYGFFKRFVQL